MTNAASAFPALQFSLAASIKPADFSYAIFFRQGPHKNDPWSYWSAANSAYEQFSSAASPQTDCLNTAPGSNFTVSLPSDTSMYSGVVVMFHGQTNGIPVTNSKPSSPTPSTNPDDHFALFELTYTAPSSNGNGALLDVDISNVDQIGLTFTAACSSAPFPLKAVGIPLKIEELVSKYKTRFPASSPYSGCLHFHRKQLIAPQDVLNAVRAPKTLSYVAPSGVPPGSTTGFLSHSYFYMVSETNSSGETVASPHVFGGPLLSDSGEPAASEIKLGWQQDGNPVAYTPENPLANGLKIYRAAVAAQKAPLPGQPFKDPPKPALSEFGLLTSMTIKAWNEQKDYCYVDDAISVKNPSQNPKTTSYGFSPLSTCFDLPLQNFFAHYMKETFWIYQSSQMNGTSIGTMWTGQVTLVTPDQGKPITSSQYVSSDGTQKSIAATWQWGDGKQSYYVLQLVGNAYDQNDLSNHKLAGKSSLTKGEYEGAVINLYFPYFQDNTGRTKMPFPAPTSPPYTLPTAPTWLVNATSSPSEQVFACNGVFSTVNDPDATAQQTSFAGLAVNALTNLENVIVSGLNRGLATDKQGWLAPMQYTSLFQFSQAAIATPAPKGTSQLSAGLYTYALAGVLKAGGQTALSWTQTVVLTSDSSVELSWLPQSAALYEKALVYRRSGSGSYVLIAELENTEENHATSYTDTGTSCKGPAAIVFYPDFDGATAPLSNLYSAFLHQNVSADPVNGISINGLVYGYPFDDQGSFSTNINFGKALPKSITIAVNN